MNKRHWLARSGTGADSALVKGTAAFTGQPKRLIFRIYCQ